jgi:hypothetical protein
MYVAYKTQVVIAVQANNLFVLRNATVGFKTIDYFRHNKKSNFPHNVNGHTPAWILV